MILRRVIEHVKAQNWLAVFLDFVIVVIGVFIGMQVSNWNNARSLHEQFAWARANAGSSPEEITRPPAFDHVAFLERARSRPEIVDSLRSTGAVQQRLRDDSRDMAARAEVLAERVRAELDD